MKESSKELADEPERGAISKTASPKASLENGVAYWLASPKARPYIKVQNDISVALRSDDLTEEQQKWLFDKEMEAAREASQNTPPDKHPCLRMTLEISACCAVGITILLVGIGYRLCQAD